MEPVRLLPDAELVIVGALSGLLGGSFHVSWDLPQGSRFDDILATKTIVHVIRGPGGGMAFRKAVDEAVIDVEVYARSRSLASSGMRTVRAYLESLKNTTHGAAHISGSYEASGPTNLPENNPNVTRKGVTYRFIIRPA